MYTTSQLLTGSAHLYSYVTDLTISLRTFENSPAKDFSNSRSSQRDALNSISKGLYPLFAILFTVDGRQIGDAYITSKESIKMKRFICAVCETVYV